MIGVIAPVTKEATVPLSPEDAYSLFTDGIAEWWPLEEHSVGQADAVSVAFDGGVGGRLYETGNDGSQTVWGEILKWDPPKGLAFSWHPGGDAQNATEVEITFERVSDGTRISLEHRGWEQVGEKAAEMRDAYDSGWNIEIDRFVAVAGARAG